MARVQKMYRVPAAGPRRPAVEGPVEREVRPRWWEDAAPRVFLDYKPLSPPATIGQKCTLGRPDKHCWGAPC